MKRLQLILVAWLLLAALPSGAADWPQWRGMYRDGRSPEVPLRLPAKRLLWRRPMSGPAHGGMAVAGGRVVVPDWRQGTDFFRCYDARTGAPLWTHSYANPGEMEWGAGPRATPLIHGGRVYTLGAMGDLHCLDAATGALLWARNFAADFGAKVPPWGYAASPLIVDDKLIVAPGAEAAALVALNPLTGALRWQTPGKPAAYGSFIAGVLGGVLQVVGYDKESLGGWEVAAGRRLWSLPCSHPKDANVGTPVKLGERLLVASPVYHARLFSFGAGGVLDPAPQATNARLGPDAATPVATGGLVFGPTMGLVCLDPARGLRDCWRNEQEEPLAGFCSLIAGNGRLLVLTETGILYLIAADAGGCRILGRMAVCEKTWSHPALADGRLYVRDEEWLSCYQWH